jgi:hypothetical protein
MIFTPKGRSNYILARKFLFLPSLVCKKRELRKKRKRRLKYN